MTGRPSPRPQGPEAPRPRPFMQEIYTVVLRAHTSSHNVATKNLFLVLGVPGSSSRPPSSAPARLQGFQSKAPRLPRPLASAVSSVLFLCLLFQRPPPPGFPQQVIPDPASSRCRSFSVLRPAAPRPMPDADPVDPRQPDHGRPPPRGKRQPLEGGRPCRGGATGASVRPTKVPRAVR